MAEKPQKKHVTVPALYVLAPSAIGFLALLMVQGGFQAVAVLDGLLGFGVFLLGACRVKVFWR